MCCFSRCTFFNCLMRHGMTGGQRLKNFFCSPFVTVCDFPTHHCYTNILWLLSCDFYTDLAAQTVYIYDPLYQISSHSCHSFLTKWHTNWTLYKQVLMGHSYQSPRTDNCAVYSCTTLSSFVLSVIVLAQVIMPASFLFLHNIYQS